MTVLEGIQRSADFLAAKGVESPRLQAELLLARVLNLPRMRLYLQFERILTDPEINQVREMVVRRGKREPLQHILGSSSFCGFELAAGPEALVPRPETELLAEKGWEFLNTLAQTGLPLPTALDLGTGSGCIGIALARRCPTAFVTAIDISPIALALAAQNAARNGVAGRIRFVEGDWLSAIPGDTRFHLIITNPPYIPSGEIAKLDPEVKDHDPVAALDGGPDGLAFYRRLAEAGRFLEPGGRVMLELGDDQAGSVTSLLETEKWIVEGVAPDYTGRLRILTAKRSD